MVSLKKTFCGKLERIEQTARSADASDTLLRSSMTKVFDMARIGELLRARRKELGYTQEQVSELMGCSPRLIGEAERGRDTVAIGTVIRYANGLGLDIFIGTRGGLA